MSLAPLSIGSRFLSRAPNVASCGDLQIGWAEQTPILLRMAPENRDLCHCVTIAIDMVTTYAYQPAFSRSTNVGAFTNFQRGARASANPPEPLED